MRKKLLRSKLSVVFIMIFSNYILEKKSGETLNIFQKNTAIFFLEDPLQALPEEFLDLFAYAFPEKFQEFLEKFQEFLDKFQELLEKFQEFLEKLF